MSGRLEHEALGFREEQRRVESFERLLENASAFRAREGEEIYLLTKLRSASSEKECQGVMKMSWVRVGRHPAEQFVHIEFRQVNASQNETLEGYPVAVTLVPGEPAAALSEFHGHLDTFDLAMMAEISDTAKAMPIDRARYQDFT